MRTQHPLPETAVSIVINTLNRADLLDDAIRGVFQLDYSSYELIVVNGPSADHSEEVLARWRGRIKHLRCDVPNLSVSRNVGIAAASGEVVAFLDDDAVPHPTWLSQLTKHYANPQVGGVGGFTVDNTGVRWQVRKTICDRFGNAKFVDDYFDERALNFPGTPYYPSLLGTNSSFRRAALYQIGGFDHTFAYLLDETDVCLRLVDSGWHVLYEPSALIFHQFAQSHMRSISRKPRTLYPSVVSKSYFINRHGQPEGAGEVGRQIEAYRDELFRANKWLADHGDISIEHRISLDLDVEEGCKAGLAKSWKVLAEGKPRGDLPDELEPGEFLAADPNEALRVALVSQGIPPKNDAGIARWTGLVAKGLRDLGLKVHVISRAADLPSRRYRDGIWYHAVARDPETAPSLAVRHDVPPVGMADWMAGVERELQFIKTFGLDLVSFPIWDLEALPALDDADTPVVMSLHTTYLLAHPFKPEWNTRVVYGRCFVDKVIAAERSALYRAPAILANSRTVIDEIERGYEVEIAPRTRIVPHGTPDILAHAGLSLDDKLARARERGGLTVLVPGRFELRKGYDLSLRLVEALSGNGSIRFVFVGQDVDGATTEKARADCGVDLRRLDNAVFHGSVSRERLDALYAAADVVLMPSRFESFGLVAIEAMSAGTPVLALASGALPEVVEEGRSGVLLADNGKFVPAAAAFLAGLAQDRGRVDALSLGAYEAYRERYTVEAMAEALVDYYREVIAARRAGA